MKNFRMLIALLATITLTLRAAKADESISYDDLQNDGLILEDAGDALDAEESPMDIAEDEEPLPQGEEGEPIPPEEGSGDVPVLSMRSFSLGAGKKAAEAFECTRTEDADSAEVTMLCQGGGLLAVPEDVDASTTVLDMSFNNLTQLSASTFPDKLENLKILRLSNNFIHYIDKNAFGGLPRLEIIDLSGNALTGLDPETFSGLAALSELDLGENSLELPAAGLFLGVPALRKLRLAGCGLQQLPESTFDGVTSLEELLLGDNPIADGTGIAPGVFAALSNLSALTLPMGASPVLLAEVCRSHGLLPAVCLGSCAKQSLPCHPPLPEGAEAAAEGTTTTRETPPGMIARAEFDAAFVPAAIDLPKLDPPKPDLPKPDPAAAEAPAEAAAAEKAAPKNRTASSPADSVPESSRSGVSGAGVNKTVIGLIIGGMLAAVALVVVKKNWSKIRGEGARRTGAGAQRPAAPLDPEAARAPEEVPLQTKSPPV